MQGSSLATPCHRLTGPAPVTGENRVVEPRRACGIQKASEKRRPRLTDEEHAGEHAEAGQDGVEGHRKALGAEDHGHSVEEEGADDEDAGAGDDDAVVGPEGEGSGHAGRAVCFERAGAGSVCGRWCAAAFHAAEPLQRAAQPVQSQQPRRRTPGQRRSKAVKRQSKLLRSLVIVREADHARPDDDQGREEHQLPPGDASAWDRTQIQIGKT